jgi:phosphoserine aminotransferase
MLNFYPGPSQLDSQVQRFFNEAIETDILEQNHRSAAFMAVIEKLKAEFALKLDLPSGYEVLLTSSATECWQIVLEALVEQSSTHVYNGSFGEKWHHYATQMVPKSHSFAFNCQHQPELVKAEELLCLTHNETSNGTSLSDAYLTESRLLNIDKLIAIDATSSMGGLALPWHLADVWLASVQKCFGLPAGLGILVVSQRAIKVAESLKKPMRYNSLLNIRENFQKNQTPYTPNLVGIYLLMRLLEHRPHINEISSHLKNRAEFICKETNNLNLAKLHILDPSIRSSTVFCFELDQKELANVHKRALANGIILGKGYGSLAGSTFRIANFPAIFDQAFDRLIEFLKSY